MIFVKSSTGSGARCKRRQAFSTYFNSVEDYHLPPIFSSYCFSDKSHVMKTPTSTQLLNTDAGDLFCFAAGPPVCSWSIFAVYSLQFISGEQSNARFHCYLPIALSLNFRIYLEAVSLQAMVECAGNTEQLVLTGLCMGWPKQ